MALPNFICVGAEKAGTTPLFGLLKQHPDIFMPPIKETHYFSRNFGRQSLAWYEGQLFMGYRRQKLIGECTPEYMRFPEVPGRMLEALGPELKLIFCLREPVRRAFSQYHQRCRLLEETESFETAIALEEQRIAEDPYMGRRRSYIGGSRYAEQIDRFLAKFPRDNMFFVVMETDLVQNRALTLDRLFDFLEVSRGKPIDLDVPDSSVPAPRIVFGAEKQLKLVTHKDNLILNPGDIFINTGNAGLNSLFLNASTNAVDYFNKLKSNLTTDLSEDLAERLYRTHFSEDVSRLEQLLDRDLSMWRR